MAQTVLPASIRPFLPEYREKVIDLEEFRVILMERVLEHGTRPDVRWLLSCYEKHDFADFLRKHGARRLSPRSLNFWSLFFHEPIPSKTNRAPWNK